MANQVCDFPNEVLSKGDLEESIGVLKEFNTKNKNAFSFGNDDSNVRRKFTSHLIEFLQSNTKNDRGQGVNECLESLVVMSRDHSSMMGKFVSKETWNMLAELAGLGKRDIKDENSFNRGEVIHACKCLCNIIFITKDSMNFCNDDQFIESVVERLKEYDPATSGDDLELEFLTLRFLFLITVLNVRARSKFVEDYNGRRLLIDYLSSKLQLSEEVTTPNPFARREISSNHAKSCSEILKTLFNVNIKVHNEENQVREEKITLEFFDLSSVCRKCFLLKVREDELATEKLHSDAGNCMYSIPSSCFSEERFIPEVAEQDKGDMFSYEESDIPTVERRDMSAVNNIIDAVEKKIERNQLSTDSLQPILALLSHLSRNSRFIRKFCKQRVIPPRHDFEHRPEVGPEFRNRLIKLFTNANTEVKAAAADFVFVLCKEKVDRLVKYTGYGNAAGLLASRGLLAGGRGDTVYSDTDSDSDTDEYLESADRINPITGHIPPHIPDPMEGMSDEQKEYIAVQLANQISKLSEADVFQPVCIDEKTGKLVPFRQKVHETEVPVEKDSDDESD